MAGWLPGLDVGSGFSPRFKFTFPENGLFDPDVVPGLFVVGDGVIRGVAAFPACLAIFAVAGNGQDACCFCRSGHGTNF